MARPKKQGLEYFTCDVNFYQDIKIRKLIRHKGVQAVSVYHIILCQIYASGYYLKWDEDLPFIIAESAVLQEDYVNGVIRYCLEIGLFSKVMYDSFKVLTSKGIQERYFFVNNLMKRKKEAVYPYLLLLTDKKSVSSEETPIISEETPVISEETPVISEETPVNSGKSTQSKVKETKVKDIDSSLRSESPSSLPTTVKGGEINYLAFMEFFNNTMQQHGAQIPTITQISMKRRQALTARAREHGKEALRTAVINAATAPFLNGASDKPFVANFDWIFRPTNFVKVLEGNYNHEITNPNTTYHATGNNNGYRTSEDLRQGAARIIAQMSAEAEQPEEKLPVV